MATLEYRCICVGLYMRRIRPIWACRDYVKNFTFKSVAHASIPQRWVAGRYIHWGG